jgi:hypothetical protein
VNAMTKKTTHGESFQSNYTRLQMGLEVILGLVVILVGWNRDFRVRWNRVFVWVDWGFQCSLIFSVRFFHGRLSNFCFDFSGLSHPTWF